MQKTGCKGRGLSKCIYSLAHRSSNSMNGRRPLASTHSPFGRRRPSRGMKLHGRHEKAGKVAFANSSDVLGLLMTAGAAKFVHNSKTVDAFCLPPPFLYLLCAHISFAAWFSLPSFDLIAALTCHILSWCPLERPYATSLSYFAWQKTGSKLFPRR